jgi:hypothetical protein
VAEELLHAVAGGDERSLELASRLAQAVLEDDVVERARQLEKLVLSRSPFALVRAVELAERIVIHEHPALLLPPARASAKKSG